METSIVIAGFGGQGVLFAGQLLAYAAMDSDKHVTWMPSYGPEMRGGTANCTIIISEQAIGAPTVAHPDIAVVLNRPSFEKYEPLIEPGGLLLVNRSLVSSDSERTDIEVIGVRANDIAEEFGSSKMLNVAALGALLANRPVITLDCAIEALAKHLPESKASLLEANLGVLRSSYERNVSVPIT